MQTYLKSRQRELRKRMPPAELTLWRYVRMKQLRVKFRRQYTFNNRIIDFYSPQIKLGIEVDGESHFWSEAKRRRELERDQQLERKYGIKILRFYNEEIYENLEGVIDEIITEIKLRQRYLNPPPKPPPLGKGEE